MSHDPRRKILDLLRLAKDGAIGGENERTAAAMKVCELLDKTPGLLVDVPMQGSSKIHPAAEARRRWRRMVKEKQLWQGECNFDDGCCASCGKDILPGHEIVAHFGEDLATHADCREWWYGFEPAPPHCADDDIPF